MRTAFGMTARLVSLLAALAALGAPGAAFAQGAWATKAPLPTSRGGAAVGVVEEHLVVVSGFSSVSPVHTTETDAYGSRIDNWFVTVPALTERAYAGAAGIFSRLYVVGGCASSADCRIGTTNVLEVFNVRTQTWSPLTPMPTARSTMVTAAIGTKLYVVGGMGPCPPCYSLDTVEVYDSLARTWTTKSPMPTARSHAGGAVINGKLYVVGGAHVSPTDPGTFLATLEVYDPASDTWTTNAPLPAARAALGAGAVNGILYAVSGQLAGGATTNVVEAYDPATDGWQTVAPIPTARYLPQPKPINGVLYVVGAGASNTPITTLEAFTP